MLDKKDLPKISIAFLAFVLFAVLAFTKVITGSEAADDAKTVAAVLIGGLSISVASGKLGGILGALLGNSTTITETTTAPTTDGSKTVVKLSRKATSIAPLAGLLVFLLVLTTGCTGVPVVSPTAVQDFTDAICTELEANAQTDTAYVQFACSIVDPTGKKAPQTFTAKVKKDTAKAFAASHCNPVDSATKLAP